MRSALETKPHTNTSATTRSKRVRRQRTDARWKGQKHSPSFLIITRKANMWQLLQLLSSSWQSKLLMHNSADKSLSFLPSWQCAVAIAFHKFSEGPFDCSGDGCFALGKLLSCWWSSPLTKFVNASLTSLIVDQFVAVPPLNSSIVL